MLGNSQPLIVIASSNIDKARELANYLKDSPFKVELLRDAGNKLEGTEGETDYEANAIAKARRAARLSGKMAIGEDSGLEVAALEGKPGPLSARFASPDATAEENNRELLERLRAVPETDRFARFVSVAALALPTGEVQVFKGECKGSIAPEPKGKYGFGYDPLFVPEGHDKTFGELGARIKDEISHRAVAMAKVREHLNSIRDC